jgi:tetratricopeptide (TPR) repeat protein
MRKIVLMLVMLGSLVFNQNVFAAVEDDLRGMLTDARGAILMGDFENALSFCDKAIETKADFAEAYAVRSEAKVYMKDSDGAMADAKKAIELAPEDKSIHAAYYVRAIIALDFAAEPDKALEFVNKAIELTSLEPVGEYYELRSDIHKAMGHQDLADADLSKVDEIFAAQEGAK